MLNNENLQDTNDAKGLEEISCDPKTPPPAPGNQASAAGNGTVIRPHR